MKKTRQLAILGIGVALYVVFSFLKVPLINQIRTDFGYLVFGVFLSLYGWPAAAVGVFGCVISNLLYTGTFPIGWAIGQTLIGVSCGLFFVRTEKTWLKCAFGVAMVFVGIGVVKTLVESALFHLPLAAKFVRGLVASVADALPFGAGIVLADRVLALRKNS